MVFVIVPSTEDLQHHGIKGQKWGVRRYQNKDGSLTTAGRARYGSNGESENSAKSGSSTKIKVAAAVGIGVASILAAYGGYSLYKSGKLDTPIAKGKATMDKILGKPSKDKIKATLSETNIIARSAARNLKSDPDAAEAAIRRLQEAASIADKIGKGGGSSRAPESEGSALKTINKLAQALKGATDQSERADILKKITELSAKYEF